MLCGKLCNVEDMNRENTIKVVLISFSVLVVLSILGFAYAYFILEIEGTPKDIVMSTGDLRLEYKDETDLKLDGAVPISDILTTGTIKGNISIDPEVTQEYTVTVTFDNKNYDQNYNKNKSFTGKIGIQEFTPFEACTFDGELVQGAEYVNGQYTYKYKNAASQTGWSILSDYDGWGVMLTDKNSIDPVTSKLCTSINGKPIVDMSYMFWNSKVTSIDLSSFNTSNVVNMSNMFDQCKKIKTIYASNRFVTDNVTSSSGMFRDSLYLKGGAGTSFSSSHTDKEYARIDGGTSSPGYVTLKNN